MATKILVIDDNADITYSVKATLEDIDSTYSVKCANSGKEGLEAAEKIRPDIVLLDVMMPDMSGWIVNKQLKLNAKTKDIPVVFLTAKTDAVSKDMGTQGAKAFLTKPFEPNVVDKTIKQIISSGEVKV